MIPGGSEFDPTGRRHKPSCLRCHVAYVVQTNKSHQRSHCNQQNIKIYSSLMHITGVKYHPPEILCDTHRDVQSQGTTCSTNLSWAPAKLAKPAATLQHLQLSTIRLHSAGASSLELCVWPGAVLICAAPMILHFEVPTCCGIPTLFQHFMDTSEQGARMSSVQRFCVTSASGSMAFYPPVLCAPVTKYKKYDM